MNKYIFPQFICCVLYHHRLYLIKLTNCVIRENCYNEYIKMDKNMKYSLSHYSL